MPHAAVKQGEIYTPQGHYKHGTRHKATTMNPTCHIATGIVRRMDDLASEPQ